MHEYDRLQARYLVQGSVWGKGLTEAEADTVLGSLSVHAYAKGEHVAAAGTEAAYWIGVVDGFVAQSATDSEGHTTFLSAVGNEAWFGEGTLLRRERWGYDAIALRDTLVALVPIGIFEWLRERSLPFNHFLQVLMNERIANFVGLIIASRNSTIEGRVARALVEMFNPALYTRQDRYIKIHQADLAMLAGTSRQRVNAALHQLAAENLIEIFRQGIGVSNLAALEKRASTGRG